jgi:hypothetical protein
MTSERELEHSVPANLLPFQFSSRVNDRLRMGTNYLGVIPALA